MACSSRRAIAAVAEPGKLMIKSERTHARSAMDMLRASKQRWCNRPWKRSVWQLGDEAGDALAAAPQKGVASDADEFTAALSATR